MDEKRPPQRLLEWFRNYFRSLQSPTGDGESPMDYHQDPAPDHPTPAEGHVPGVVWFLLGTIAGQLLLALFLGIGGVLQ